MKQEEEIIELTEANQYDWRQFLDEFEEQVWPLFCKHGFTKGEALLIFELNKMNNELTKLNENLTDDIS